VHHCRTRCAHAAERPQLARPFRRRTNARTRGRPGLMPTAVSPDGKRHGVDCLYCGVHTGAHRPYTNCTLWAEAVPSFTVVLGLYNSTQCVRSHNAPYCSDTHCKPGAKRLPHPYGATVAASNACSPCMLGIISASHSVLSKHESAEPRDLTNDGPRQRPFAQWRICTARLT
jgi:hypothetical protein